MYYRALDYVCEAKETIEKKLYAHLTESGMDNTLLLYDITFLYFEGTQAPLAKRGHFRDKRGDLEQIVVGMVLSRDGLPIAHHVLRNPQKRTQEFGYADLSADMQKNYDKNVRFVVCYNPVVAKESKKTREKNMRLFEELLERTPLQEKSLEKIQKAKDTLKSFLARKHMKRFYTVNRETLRRVQRADVV